MHLGVHARADRRARGPCRARAARRTRERRSDAVCIKKRKCLYIRVCVSGAIVMRFSRDRLPRRGDGRDRAQDARGGVCCRCSALRPAMCVPVRSLSSEANARRPPRPLLGRLLFCRQLLLAVLLVIAHLAHLAVLTAAAAVHHLAARRALPLCGEGAPLLLPPRLKAAWLLAGTPSSSSSSSSSSSASSSSCVCAPAADSRLPRPALPQPFSGMRTRLAESV